MKSIAKLHIVPEVRDDVITEGTRNHGTVALFN